MVPLMGGHDLGPQAAGMLPPWGPQPRGRLLWAVTSRGPSPCGGHTC